MNKPVKRAYDSSRRQEQARQTRRDVLQAAHDLFVELGYARTTIADIARAAGVSPELIYATFKNKATVLARVWDVTIGGDDEDVVFHERPQIVALRAEPDLAKRFMGHARMWTATARRIAPLALAVRAAAGAEPAAAEMVAEMNRQRYVGLGFMAADAAATGQLAVTQQECRDVIWAMSDAGLWHQFVVERSWTDEQFADWLGRAWVATLVVPKRGRTRK